MTRKVNDITGRVFGHLTALSLAPATKGKTRWHCRCACGVVLVVDASHLVSGHTKSCGCIKSEILADLKRTHGGSFSQEYAIWNTMRRRCHNAKCHQYANYGAKGIVVCGAWRKSFAAFQADMGPRPTPKHSLDRIDGAGNYEPGNVRWATPKEQGRNRANVLKISLGGEVRPAIEVYEQSNKVVSYRNFFIRIRAGWDVQRALSTPRQNCGGHP